MDVPRDFILLVVVGVVLAVGSSPLGDSSPFGAAFRSFSATSTAGFALRHSAPRVPLVALGLAALLAAGVSSFHYRLNQHGYKRVGFVVVVVVVVFCLVDTTGVWGRNYYDTTLEWRSIPAYWRRAAASLDAKSHDSRVLALPGSPFAAYTWGTTQDPVEPTLMNRPFATIEQIPEGSDPAANLLAAIDVPLQAGDLDPDALAPVTRLMGAGDVLLDMDLLASRYGLVDPAVPHNVVTTAIFLPQSGGGMVGNSGKYAGKDISQVFYAPLLERLSHLPGVDSAALTSVLPLSPNFSATGTFEIVGRAERSGQQAGRGRARGQSQHLSHARHPPVARTLAERQR